MATLPPSPALPLTRSGLRGLAPRQALPLTHPSPSWGAREEGTKGGGAVSR